jgi:hypothetical protein
MDFRYPKAKWKGDGVSGGEFAGKPWRVVLHTTETTVLPGYHDGSYAPHFTAVDGILVQHTSLQVASRALYNAPGGVQTNRDNAIQVEIVAYTNAVMMPEDGRWIGDFTASDLSPVHDLLVWLGGQVSLRMIYPPESLVFSFEDWDNYNGVCGHVNVPENVHGHWDPTGLQPAYLGLSVFGAPVPAPAPTPAGEDMYQSVMYQDGYGTTSGSEAVKVWQRILVALGHNITVDGKYGPNTAAAVFDELTGDNAPHIGPYDGTFIDELVGAFLISSFAPVHTLVSKYPIV